MCEGFSVDFFTCFYITLLTYFEHAIYLYLSSMALLIAAVKLGTSSQETILNIIPQSRLQHFLKPAQFRLKTQLQNKYILIFSH
jgi:hypothetical protein